MTGVNQPWKVPPASSEPPEFIRFLEQLRPFGPWVLTAIIPDGPTETITATTHEQVILFVQRTNGKKNIYFSVNPTRTPLTHKASKLDIAAVEYLLADLDPRHDEAPEDAKTRYLAALIPHRPAATAIIDSGNGLQALWKLAEPIVLSDLITDGPKKALIAKDLQIVEDVEARTAALMTKLGSVAGTQNIDRILRLPGTLNIPNKKKLESGRQVCPTKLVRFNDILCALDDFPLPEVTEHKVTNGTKPINSAELFKRLPAALRKAIASPPYEGEDTSETAASVIAQLQAKSLTDEDVIALFNAFPLGIGKRYAQGKDLKADVTRLRKKYQNDPINRKTSLIIRASDIQPRAKKWLWQGHLLCGALELLTGMPGLGKSQVQISYIACATAALPWPDGAPPCQPVNVIMLTAEDTIAEEVRPRLMAAKADCERIFIFNKIRKDGKDRQFLLGEDLDEIEKNAIEIGNVGLITIDPITAYMGGKIDSHKATEVRSQLGPLKDFSERTGIALSAITHPAKQASMKAIDQFIGSQAFVAACRIGHVCVEEFNDDDGERSSTGRVLFTHAKHNASRKQNTLAYEIEEVFVANDYETAEPIQSPRVLWAAESVDITADEAVAASNSAAPAKARGLDQDKLQNLLCSLLREGPLPQKQIEEKIVEAGFTLFQLRRAKEILGVVSERVENAWTWRLLI